MDIGKSLTYIFEDPRWLTKVAIGTVVLIISSLLSPILIGILGFFIFMGYSLDVVRNVRRGVQYPMPEWQDRWVEWLVLGIKLAALLFIWALPAVLVTIPMIFGGVLLDNQGTEWLGILLLTGLTCLMLVWTVIVTLVSPAIYIRLAETEDFTSGLQFGDILSFTRENLGDVIVATIVFWAVSLVVGLLAGLAGSLLCFFGLFVTVPLAQLYIGLVQAHLYGQIGLRRSAEGTGTEMAPEPTESAERLGDAPALAPPEPSPVEPQGTDADWRGAV
jgi:hypothetical protein